MKKYNRILEAINKGILLALDDIENIEDNNSISSDIINTDDIIKKHIEFNNYWVDLGLPSGTLWARYNIGVNLEYIKPQEWWCDLDLLKPEDWYGNYYSWGEIETKDKYTWETYKFGNSDKSIKKYCNDEKCGEKIIDKNSPWGYFRFKDNLTELLPEDDIATQIYGIHSHIPTEKQCEELLKYCTFNWKTDYHNVKGLNGYILMSNINYNTIFIPAAGLDQSYGLQYTKLLAWIWCSTLYYGSAARIISANSSSVNLSMHNRHIGIPIRAVYNK